MKKRTKPRKSNKSKGARTKQVFPPGWDEKRVKEVIAYYENQTEEEQVAEHEEAHRAEGQTVMVVPTELVPEIRKLIAQRRGA